MPSAQGTPPVPPSRAASATEPVGRPGPLWWLAAVVLVAVVAWVTVSRREEVAAALGLVSRVNVPRLAVALLCQAASFVCFAAVYRWLLRAGGASLDLKTLTALTAGGNAMAGVLPGGAAFSAAWVFRQLHRRGVEQVLAAAVLVAAGVLAMLGLFVLLAAGALTAWLGGTGAQLRPALWLLVPVVVGGLVVLGLSRIAGFRVALARAWAVAGRRSGRVGQVEERLVGLVEQARSVQPGIRPWWRPFTLALLNWLLDVACLAAGLWALGIEVPWHGLLLAHALTQIPGSLRLTPGSIGIVEASLATLLVVYGLRPEQAIAATLLYRICSYWVLQPIGWACWIAVTLGTGRSPRGDTDGVSE